MDCPNCKTPIKPGTAFCKNCGAKYSFKITETGVTVETSNNKSNNIEPNTNFQGYTYETSSNQSISGHEDINFNNLMHAYIGKNADKLKSGFSLCTFFFGVIYVFYRKMWALGFLWLLINLSISIFFPNLIYLNFILNIIISCYFKKLYINHVIAKVNDIQINHPTCSNSELMAICSKKGGTTIVPIVVIVVIYLLITIAATSIIMGIINDAKESAGLVAGENNSNISDQTVELRIASFDLALTSALFENYGGVTKESIKDEYDYQGTTWNADDTITAQNSKYICNVIVNAENYIFLECDVNGEKITSESMKLDY